MKVVCNKCMVEYVPETNGVFVIEMFSTPPKPYKIWYADVKKCPDCGDTITTGFGSNALMEHYEDGFDKLLERAKSFETTITVYEWR